MFKKVFINHNRLLSILLSLWVYTYALFYFVPLIIPSTTMLMYVWLFIMDVLILFRIRRVSIRLIRFLIIYVLVAAINVLVVSYKYYAAVDAFSGMAVFLPALLIMDSSSFDLKDFLSVWRKFAFYSTLLSPIAVMLMQNRVIDYGVFTYLNLPNCIIFSYYIMTKPNGNKSRISLLIMDLLNFAVILVFGGRMAAFAAAFSIFIGYLISSSVKLYKKYILIILVGVLGILVISNLNTILRYFQLVLDKHNLNSRTLSLLIEQFESGNPGLYLTRRNVIYDEVVDYIIDRRGLPGGFGVSLSISNGQFYHPHNLFLQLAVMFGCLGGVLFIAVILYRLVLLKRVRLLFEYQFTLLLLIEYVVISFTGGSILNNYVAILGIGMIFFYRGMKQNSRKSMVVR